MLSHNSECSSVISLEEPSPSGLSCVSTPESLTSSPSDVRHHLHPTGFCPTSDSSILYHSFPTTSTPTVCPFGDPIDDQQPPLLITNPCYQSPLLRRRELNGVHSPPSDRHHPRLPCPTAIASVTPLTNDNSNSSLSSTPSHPTSFAVQLLQHQQSTQPPSFISSKRTVSMQTVGTDCSIRSPIGSRASSILHLVSSDLCDQCFPFDSQNVTIVDWLNDVSLDRLGILSGKYSSDVLTGPNRWYKRMQMVKHLRSVIRQFRDKAQLSLNGATAASTYICSCPSNSLYGVPLGSIQAHTSDGSPLPRFVHDMMEWLTKKAQCSDGIFRKNGVKVRILEIKEACARLSTDQPIPYHLLTDSASNDVADALKQYFRELPECLITDRISELIETMVSELPEEKHFTALQYCILMLPTEHREALMVLLRFLNGITRHSPTNQMTSGCVATCWMPTLFRFTHFAIPSDNGTLNKRLARRKTIGMPNEKERKAYEAIKRMLTMMIDGWERLMYLPNGLAREIANTKLEVCHDLEMPMKNGQFDFSEELQRHFKQQLHRLKEDYLSGWKHWDLQRVFPNGSQLFTRTINDMIPLKAFRAQTSIAASPNLILAAILHNRHLWDSQVRECRRIGPSGQNFDILKVTYGAPLKNGTTAKHTFVARRWRYSEFDSDGIALLTERSIVPRSLWRAQFAANHISIYKSEFLVVPVCSGHSYVTCISRADFRGKTSEWYDKVYGRMVVQHLQSLKKQILRCRNGLQGTIV